MICVKVGYGFFVEFTFAEALEFIEKKISSLNHCVEQCSKDACMIKAKIKVVLEVRYCEKEVIYSMKFFSIFRFRVFESYKTSVQMKNQSQSVIFYFSSHVFFIITYHSKDICKKCVFYSFLLYILVDETNRQEFLE